MALLPHVDQVWFDEFMDAEFQDREVIIIPYNQPIIDHFLSHLPMYVPDLSIDGDIDLSYS